MMQIIFSGFLTCFSISMSEKMSIGENEEPPMYCCLTFSYAVKYGFITIDYKRNSVEIPLRNLTDDKRQEIMLKLQKHKHKERIITTHMDPAYLYPVHCPWCGVHLNIAIDFDKSCREGQYSPQPS
jgi:hypothetical protein